MRWLRWSVLISVLLTLIQGVVGLALLRGVRPSRERSDSYSAFDRAQSVPAHTTCG